MLLRSRAQLRPPPATRQRKNTPRDVTDKNGPGRSRLPMQPCRAFFRFGNVWDCCCANSRILHNARHYDYNPSTDELKSSTQGASSYYTQPLLLPWSFLRRICALPSLGSYEYSYVVLSPNTRKLGPRILSIRVSAVFSSRRKVPSGFYYFFADVTLDHGRPGHGTFQPYGSGPQPLCGVHQG